MDSTLFRRKRYKYKHYRNLNKIQNNANCFFCYTETIVENLLEALNAEEANLK